MDIREQVKLSDVLQKKGYIRGPFGSALKRGDMKDKGIPVYEQQHAIYDHRDFRYFIDDEKFNVMQRFQVKTNDLIISCSGTVGKVSIIKEEDPKGIISQALLILRADTNKILPEYLQYFFTSREGYNAIVSRSSGSVQVNISKRDVIEQIPMSLPSLNSQKKVVDILGQLDKKIKTNEEINKNLEQQIEAILLKTIDNANTQPVKLGDYLYIKGRIGWKGLKKSEYLPVSDYRIINGESLTLSGIDWNKAGYISAERYEESPEIMLNIGDILLSKDGTIGKIGYVDKLETPASVASGIFVIRNTKQNEISTQFIYYLLKSHLFKAFIAGRTEGSVIPHLYQKDFMEFEFQLPSPQDMKIFDDTTSAMFSLVFSNLNENERLIHLRDSLLPKLISGELDVSNLDF